MCGNKVYYGITEEKVFGDGYFFEKRIHDNVGGYCIEECMKEIVAIRYIRKFIK